MITVSCAALHNESVAKKQVQKHLRKKPNVWFLRSYVRLFEFEQKRNETHTKIKAENFRLKNIYKPTVRVEFLQQTLVILENHLRAHTHKQNITNDNYTM